MAGGPGKRYKHKESGKVRTYEQLREKGATDADIQEMLAADAMVETTEDVSAVAPPAPTPAPVEKKSTIDSTGSSGGSNTPVLPSPSPATPPINLEEATGGNTLENRTALRDVPPTPPATPNIPPVKGTQAQQEAQSTTPAGEAGFTDLAEIGQKDTLKLPSRVARKTGLPQTFQLKSSPLGGMVADRKTTEEKLSGVKERFYQGKLTEDDALLLYASATGRYDRQKALDLQREHNFTANHPEMVEYEEAREKLAADIDANEQIPFSNFPMPGGLTTPIPGSAADPGRKKTAILDGSAKAFGEYAQRRIGAITDQLNNATNRTQVFSTAAQGNETRTQDQADRERLTTELKELQKAVDVVAAVKFSVDGDPVASGRNYNRYLRPEKHDEQTRFERSGLTIPEKDRFATERTGMEMLIRRNRIEAEGLKDYVQETVTSLVKRADELEDQIASTENVDAKNELIRQRNTIAEQLNNDPRIRRARELEQAHAKQIRDYATLSDKYPEQRRRELTRAIGEAVYADASPIEKAIHVEFTDDRIKKAAKELGIDYNLVKDIADKEFASGGILDALYAGALRRPAAQLDGFLNRNKGVGLATIKRMLGNEQGAEREIDKVDIENAQRLQQADDESKVADEARLFGSPTVIIKDASSEWYLREVRNADYGKDNNINWYSVLNTIGDVTGQVMNYAVGSKGVGGVLKKAGMAENAAMQMGTFTTGFVNSYEPNYQAAREFINNETERTLFATIQSAKTAATELILPDYKILDRLTGKAAVNASIKKYLDIVADAGAKGLTPTKVKSFVKETLVPILTNTAETSAKETLEEEADLVGDYVVNSLFGKDQSDRDMVREAKEIAVITVLGTLPLGIAGGGGNASRLKKDAYYEAGLNPDYYKYVINKRAEDGRIKRAEADRSIEMINAMDEIIRQIPETTPAGQRLTEQQKVDVAYNRLREWKMKKAKEETTDDVLKEQLDNSIKEVQQERKDIYEPPQSETPPVDQQQSATVPTPGGTGTPSGTGTGDAERRIFEILGSDPGLRESKNPMVQSVRAAMGTTDEGQIIPTLRQQISNRDQFVAMFGEPLAAAVEGLGAEQVGRSGQEMTADLDRQAELEKEFDFAYQRDRAKNAPHAWQREQAQEFLDDPEKFFLKHIDISQKTLATKPDDQIANNVLARHTADLEKWRAINRKYDSSPKDGNRKQIAEELISNLKLPLRLVGSVAMGEDKEGSDIDMVLDGMPHTGEKITAEQARENAQYAFDQLKDFAHTGGPISGLVMKRGGNMGVNFRYKGEWVQIVPNPGANSSSKNTQDAVQKPTTTEGVLREERSEVGLQEVREPQQQQQQPEEIDEQQQGQEEVKATRFGLPSKNLPLNAFSLYSQFQDQVTEAGAQDELQQYEEQMMQEVQAQAKAKGIDLKMSDAAKVTTNIMQSVYDDAGIQDNEEKTLQQVIDDALSVYSKPKNKSNEKDTGRGGRLRLRPEEVAEQTTQREPEQKGSEQAPTPTFTVGMKLRERAKGVEPIRAEIETIEPDRITLLTNVIGRKGQPQRLRFTPEQLANLYELDTDQAPAPEPAAPTEPTVTWDSVFKKGRTINVNGRKETITRLVDDERGTQVYGKNGSIVYVQHEDKGDHYLLYQNGKPDDDPVENYVYTPKEKAEKKKAEPEEEIEVKDIPTIPQEMQPFFNAVLPNLMQQVDTAYNFRELIPEMDLRARRQAVRNIYDGDDSVGARRLIEIVKSWYEQGFVPMHRGGQGNLPTQYADIPVSEYVGLAPTPLTDEQIAAAEQALTDQMADIILTNGLTVENLPTFRERLFTGFPYTEQDYTNVENYLQQKAQSGQQDSSGSEPGQPGQQDERAGAETPQGITTTAPPVDIFANSKDLSEQEREKKLAELNAAIADFKKALGKGYMTSGGLNPEAIETGAKVIGLYAKLKIHDFKTIVRDLISKLGAEFFTDRDNVDALAGVYAYHRQNSRADRAQMDNEDAVDNFIEKDLPDLLGQKVKGPEFPKVVNLGRDNKEYRFVGVNQEGKALYEDDNGVRAKDEGSSIFSNEPVAIIPGQGWAKTNRTSDYKTVEELDNETTENQGGRGSVGTTSEGPTGTTEGGTPGVLQGFGQPGGTGGISGSEGTQVLRPGNEAGTGGSAVQPGTGGSLEGNVSDSVNVHAGTRHPGQSPIAPKREGHNYSIPPDFSHGTTFSPTQKYRDNIEALKLLINLIRQDNETGAVTMATPEQQEILFKYVGWGGLKEILFNPDREFEWNKNNQQFRKYVKEVYTLAEELDKLGLRSPENRSPLELMKDSVNNAHYTAIPIIRGIYYGLEKAGFTGGKVLEPSAGIGHFIGAMPHKMMAKSQIAAVEKDVITGNILRRLYPDAKTFVGGFEDSNAPSNYMDVVISNIPFGSDIKVYDSEYAKSKVPAKKRSLDAVHNYFFAKAIDTAREGGLIAFVTTAGVMDSEGNDYMRRHIAENTEFLGAIRLPNTAFQVNANTQVVTDIIFLRKFLKGEKAEQKHAFINTKPAEAPHKNTGQMHTVFYNEYFHNNPQNMYGTLASGGLYREDEFFLLGEDKTEDFETRIREAVDRIIPQKVYVKESVRATDPDAIKRYYIDKAQGARVGNIIEKDGNLVRIISQENDQYQVEELAKSTDKKMVRNYIQVRDALNELYAAELNDEPDGVVDPKRKKLVEAYNNYVSKHKNLLHKDNGKLVSLDIDGFNVRALEKVDKEGKIVPADILSKRTIKPYRRIESADNIQDAILISLNEYGHLNMDRMAQLRSLTPEQVMEEAEDRIYELPEGGHETRDAYLSGNVKKKLAEAKLATTVAPRFQRNVEALEKVIPADIRTSDIEVRAGARWVDAKYYAQFASELFATQVDVRYFNGIDNYKVKIKGIGTVELTNWGVRDSDGRWRMDGGEIFKHVLLSNTPQITDEVPTDIPGKTKRVVNQELTDIAYTKYNEMREKFQDWIWKDTERRQYLSRKYNDLFNTTIKRTYDGSFLSFAGYTGYELRQHQKDAVWMIIQNMGGIVDHIVGGGKTLIIVTAAMELKRMGLVKKPMIIGLKANADEIAATFRESYPLARVLAPTSADFTPKRRRALLASIALNDWDAVVITHDNYGKIPHSAEIQGSVIQEELDMLDADIADLAREQQDGPTKKQLQGLQKRKINLIAKLRALADQEKDREMRNFQELGIDKIFLDESQEFKNLEYSTKFRGVAGLGTPKGSQKAFNMLLGIRTLQKMYRGDKGVTFLSGTPISNTLVEMYLLLKYLRPNKMEELGMKTFDSWVTTFGYQFSDVEFGVTGALGNKNRFRQFINVPELSILYNEIADIRNDRNLTLPKPKMKGGKPIFVPVDQSPEQQEFSRRLIEFVRSKGDDDMVLGLGPLTDNQKKAFGLLATGLSAKSAIDLRLVFPSAEDNPTGKLAKAADAIYENWRMSTDYKGTQLVFSDIGTPKSGKVVPDLMDYLQEVKGVNEDDMTAIFGTTDSDSKSLPSINQIRQNMAMVLEYSQQEIDEAIQESKDSMTQFNIYADLKQKLIARGIPADEIQFIHDFKNVHKKRQLFKDVREGKVRVMLGSTRKMGTGVNVQDRIVAMHHIDVPWRPADMEQRDGRGIRQGNLLARDQYNNEVAVYRYGTVLTLDAYKYQLLDIKSYYINQTKENATGERIVTEEAGDDSELSTNEIIAALSGNPDILTRAKLDKKVQALARQKKNYEQEQYDAQSRIEDRQQEIRWRERNINENSQDVEDLRTRYGYDTGGNRLDDSTFETIVGARPDFIIGGVNYENKLKEAGAQLLTLTKEYRSTKPVGTREVIGSVNGMPIEVEVTSIRDFGGKETVSSQYYLVGKARRYPIQTKSLMDETWQARYVKEAVADIFDQITRSKEVIARFTEDIPKLQAMIDTPFKKADELEASRKELAEVNERLRAAAREDNRRDSDNEGGEAEGMGEANPNEPDTPLTDNPMEDIDEAIRQARRDLDRETGGQLSMGVPLNALPQLTKLAILYFQKGIKTVGQFAKEVGTRVNRVIVQAWNAAKKAVRDYWQQSQQMGAISPSMRRFLNPNPPTGGGGGGGIPGAGNTGQQPGSSAPGTAAAPGARATRTSIFALQEKRREALERGMELLASMQETMFGAADVTEDEIHISPTIAGKVFKGASVVQDVTFGAASKALTKGFKSVIKKALQSQNELAQSAGHSINNVFANLGKSDEDVLRGEKFIGETKTRWISDAVQIQKKLRDMVNNEKAALDRIDRVLDPEFYKELTIDEFKEALRYEDVNVDAMPQDRLDERYQQYRDAMGFSDPNFVAPTYDSLTMEEKQVHDLIRAMYDMMHEINFGIGKLTEETYEANKGVYSARLYKYFEIPKEAQDAMRNNPSKLDESLYKERGDITEWKLLNRLTDPVYGVTKRLFQTMANKAIIDYAQYVKNTQPDAVSKTERPGYKRLGWGYGALSNKYVRNDIAEDFVGHFYANAITQKMYDFVKQYDRIPIRQFYKKLFTVYNPGTHLGNIAGNYAFAFFTGINPLSLTANVKWAMKQAEDYTPEYRYLLSEGVLRTDHTQAEHKNAIDDMNKALENLPKGPFSKVDAWLRKVYSGVDDVFKMAAFKSLLEMGYTPKEAVDKVKQGFQNYLRVGKSYDLTSKLPLVGNPFGRFAGDLMRIFLTSLSQRPLFTLAFLQSWSLMAMLFSYMSGEDERQRRIRESRPGFPKVPFPDALGGDIPLAFKVGKNEVNLARFLSPMYVYGSANNEDSFEFFQKLSPFPIETVEYTKNPMGTAAAFLAKNANDPVLAPLVQLAANADFRGAPIYDPNETQYKKALLTDEEKGANALRFMMRQYIPYYTTADDLFSHFKTGKDYYNREREPWQIIANFIGPKITRFPDTRYGELLEKKLNNYGYQFKEEEEAIRALGKLRSRKELSQEKYVERVTPHLEKQAAIVARARKEYEELKKKAGSTPLINFDPSISRAKGKKKKVDPNMPIMPIILDDQSQQIQF
jgi:N12 class adenine-specific DNA methylase/predicted RNA methylase